MSTVVDSQNVVNSLEEAPDRLRAEIGSYHFHQQPQQDAFGPTPISSVLSGFRGYRVGIKASYIQDLENNNQVLIPTKKSRIFISGDEQMFRDQDQWNDYIGNTISTAGSFLDHQFTLAMPEVDSGVLVKNFHHPTYEDFTKSFSSNQLLNWNLISYPFKDKDVIVSRIGDLKTSFDDPSYMAGVTNPVNDLMEQFENRILNYTGSVQEVSTKQRHVFDLHRNLNAQRGASYLVEKASFPFIFKKDLPNLLRSEGLNFLLSEYGKRKNLFQSIKNEIAFSNRQFRVQGEDEQTRVYDLISLMTSTGLARFSEKSDEIYLLPEEEITNREDSDRFVNSVNAVRFLSSFRNLASSKSRSYRDVINSNSSESFFLGYKIEKYLDNDATQPIQTYYTNDIVFHDTQMKYGRKYIYKTKALVAVLGSSYRYSKLFISQNETQMMDEGGNLAEQFPQGYADVVSEKFRAYVDVEVTPSFQVIEYQIDEEEAMFVDDSPNAPQVYFFNQPQKPYVEFFFSPMYEDRDGVDDSIRMEYFNGNYEIYRMDRPPSFMSEFEDAFLVSIDDQTTLAQSLLPDYSRENMNGYYADRITPNQKYYYAFKATTYHGTKSDFTVPFVVEMVRDSDEYKVMVSEYTIPVEKDYVYERNFKRIMKITPNIERLLFSEEESLANWKLDDGNMLTKNQTTKFKIRVTSKHTGKKMDINLNFFLDDKTNS
jgi:hypothetical protein